MKNLIFAALMVSLAACNGPVPAPSAGIEVTSAYAAPSPGGVDLAAGYFTIVNHGPADRLMSASSPRAASVALHTMEMDGVVMRMRMVDTMIIPANGELTLSAGGDHLMFTGLTAPFTIGESIPVQLHFEQGGDMAVSFPVTATPPNAGH